MSLKILLLWSGRGNRTAKISEDQPETDVVMLHAVVQEAERTCQPRLLPGTLQARSSLFQALVTQE